MAGKRVLNRMQPSRKKRGPRKVGGTRKVRFHNTNASNTNNGKPKRNDPTYLNDLRNRVRSQIPEPSVIQTNDAEIMAVVLETQDTPEEMMHTLHVIYNPEQLTDAEYALANPIIKRRGYGIGINVIDSSPLPPAIKDKILRYVRYVRALRKVEHIARGKSNKRFVHEEWGPNKN
jgi:hypothetical protein